MRSKAARGAQRRRCQPLGAAAHRGPRAPALGAATPPATLAGAIRTTALEYGLMSAYTSFVAVDSTQRTAGNHGTTVNQAVPVPEGVR